MSFIEKAREAIKIVQKLDNIELFQKILDLEADGLEMSSKLLEKDKKINDLENQIKELKEILRFKKKVFKLGTFYFEKDKQGNWIFPGLCPNCWEADHKPISLQHYVRRGIGNIKDNYCPNCQNKFIYYDLLIKELNL